MDNASRNFNPKSFSQTFFAITLGILFTLIIFVPNNHAQEAAYIDIAGDIYVTASDPGVTFLNLRVMDPQGEIIFDQSSDGSPIQWVPYDVSLDGYYSYEVRVGFGGMNRVRDEAQEEDVRVRPWRKSGTVLVLGGAIVPPDEEEASLFKDICDITKLAFSRFRDFLVTPAYADVLHYDDVIITGSECLGFDCADGESFGFDTLKIKEHNLRIFFEDTSYTANYPNNDWRILINDSTDGGGSYFAIQDATEGVVPFTIEAGAPANSLYVEDNGRVGLGTSVPVVELHIADGDTPTVRLEQDGSYGWSPQTWDMAGNEASFFIRDVTNGSQLPFRIQPNTPSNTLTLRSDGNVGMGTWYPAEAVDVYRSAAASRFQLTSVTDTGNEAPQFIQRRARSGPSAVQAGDNLGLISFRGYNGSWYTGSKAAITAQASENWSGSSTGTELIFSTTPSGSTGITAVMRVTQNGKVKINGTTLNVPDYVFEDNYDLMPLDELQEYVKKEKRLPNVAGEDEVTSKGLDLGGTQMALLEKIEELTLYTLKQHEQLKEKNAQIMELTKRLSALEELIIASYTVPSPEVKTY